MNTLAVAPAGQSSVSSSASASHEAWPDFYTVLRVAPTASEDEVRQAISVLFEKATMHADHRELSKRIYSQVLREKVLPQCKRILLDPQFRAAYDEQLKLHRQGAPSAISLTEFFVEVVKVRNVSTQVIYSPAELAVLPTVGKPQNGLVPTGVQTQVQSVEQMTMRVASMSATPASAVTPAQLLETPRKSPLAMIGAGAAALVVLGGLAMFLGRSTSNSGIAYEQNAAGFTFYNGDMTRDSNGVPDHWTQRWEGKGKIAIARDENVYASAPASLRVETVGDSEGQAINALDGPVKPGQSFTISGKIKAQGDDNFGCQIALQTVGQGGGIEFCTLGFVRGSTDWRPCSVHVSLTKPATNAQVVLYVSGKGKAWADDIKITPD